MNRINLITKPQIDETSLRERWLSVRAGCKISSAISVKQLRNLHIVQLSDRTFAERKATMSRIRHNRDLIMPSESGGCEVLPTRLYASLSGWADQPGFLNKGRGSWLRSYLTAQCQILIGFRNCP